MTKAAPKTERNMSAPYGVCDVTGQTPALRFPHRREYLSPRQSARYALEEATEQHLAALILPLLGAWAAHWRSAGVTSGGLATPFETLRDQLPTFRRVSAFLRLLSAKHAPELYTPAPADRLTLALDQLPEAVAILNGETGERRGLKVKAAQTERLFELNVWPGQDYLTLELPGGDAVLLPLGVRGNTSSSILQAGGVYVPEALRSQLSELLRQDTSA